MRTKFMAVAVTVACSLALSAGVAGASHSPGRIPVGPKADKHIIFRGYVPIKPGFVWPGSPKEPRFCWIPEGCS